MSRQEAQCVVVDDESELAMVEGEVEQSEMKTVNPEMTRPQEGKRRQKGEGAQLRKTKAIA